MPPLPRRDHPQMYPSVPFVRKAWPHHHQLWHAISSNTPPRVIPIALSLGTVFKASQTPPTPSALNTEDIPGHCKRQHLGVNPNPRSHRYIFNAPCSMMHGLTRRRATYVGLSHVTQTVCNFNTIFPPRSQTPGRLGRPLFSVDVKMPDNFAFLSCASCCSRKN